MLRIELKLDEQYCTVAEGNECPLLNYNASECNHFKYDDKYPEHLQLAINWKHKRCPQCLEVEKEQPFEKECPFLGKKGKWLYRAEYNDYACSQCGTDDNWQWSFCKKCGQPMEVNPICRTVFKEMDELSRREIGEQILNEMDKVVK